MKIEIGDIRKRDYRKAIEFAVRGMHFDWYMDNRFLLNAYGRYFWYLELNRATQVLAAYVDGKFAGVLLADVKNEKKKHQSLWQKLYVKAVDAIQKPFFKGGVGPYDEITKRQLSDYLKSNSPDGEIIFLAADPDCKKSGIGTALLDALENREPGKTFFLYTDNACSYQFYEHRGFRRAEENKIELDMPTGIIPLRCFLYSKKLSA
ncbi:MAG: GNAT family N-acetyltransferase [Eubacterium sp.]